MKIKNLTDLFSLKLKALYDMETKLVKALPKMAKAATDPELKQSFEDHLKETQGHVDRIEKAFSLIGLDRGKTDVAGISGIIEDAEWMIGQKLPPAAMDAALISSARYAEHYEMAGYLSAIAMADVLGYDDIVDLLGETLAEEKDADRILSEAAEGSILEQAMSSGSDEGEEDED